MRVGYSRDGSQVITSSNDDTVRLWNALTRAEIQVLKVVGAWEEELSPEGTRLATVSRDYTVRLWDTATGAQIALLRGFGDYFPSFAFSRDGKRLLVQFNSFLNPEDMTRLVNTDTGQEVAQLKGRLTWRWPWRLDDAKATAFSEDGRRIVTSSRDSTIRIWDIKDRSLVASIKGHENAVTHAEYSHDGRLIVSGSIDGTVRVWTEEPSSVIKTYRGHSGAVRSVSVSPDGTKLATASADRTARLWDVSSGVTLRVLKGHADIVNSARFSPDASHALTASADKTARIWDALTGTTIMSLDGHDDSVIAAAFSPDGSRIATGSSDKTARIWRVKDWSTLTVLKEHDGQVSAASFSPDGQRIFTSATGIIGLIWDSDGGAKVQELRPETDNSLLSKEWNQLFTQAERMARSQSRASGWGTSYGVYSPDGKKLATSSYGKFIQIWDASTALRSRALGTLNSINSVEFSPDGTRLVAAYVNGAAQTWSVEGSTPGEQFSIAEYQSSRFGHVHSASYLPNGFQIVTASDDEIVRLWHVPRCQALIDSAREWLPRELSPSEREKYFLYDKPTDQLAKISSEKSATIRFSRPFSLSIGVQSRPTSARNSAKPSGATLRCAPPALMLWTAPPPARECQGCGCC